jgi:hypothetical protein
MHEDRPTLPGTDAIGATRATTEIPGEPEAGPPDEFGKTPVGAGLRWLARHQNEGGSWGDVPVTLGGQSIGPVGVTSLALLSFIGAGYSHLSRDEYDADQSIGEVVKRALKWCLKEERADGTFPSPSDPGFDQALATLAICEAYGATASPTLKGPSEKALEALIRLQGSDGSWGGAEPTSWAIQALTSAKMSDLACPQAVCALALTYLDATPHPANGFNRILLTRNRQGAQADALALAGQLPIGEERDFNDWCHASQSMFQLDGPEGPLWKGMNENLKNLIVPLQWGDGSWPGGTSSHTVVRTSLAELTLQVYYGYSARLYSGSTSSNHGGVDAGPEQPQ